MTRFRPGELNLHRDPGELGRTTRALRATGRKVVLVPTMGALHTGHQELIQTARKGGAVTVVSIFVNPTQFGAGEDLDRYPRQLEADLEVCREQGVELVLAPDADAIYPPGSDTMVSPGPLGAELEGASRPGHFAGVLTVVAKLFSIIRPDQAFFGEKDYQQLVLIRRMARDLFLDVDVRGVPTVRERDGLAMSSRNVYLDPAQRRAAVALFSALVTGAHQAWRGAEAALAAAHDVLAAEPAVELDYLELRDRALGPAPTHGEGRLLIAAKVGNTRLIDNVGVLLGATDGSIETGGSTCSARC